MNGEFMPMSLGTSSGNTSTYATTKTDQTDMDIWKELGIEVKTQDDDLGLNFEDYLQLMVQQLQNQTMDNTMDSSAMLNQLVQMSTVQMMASLKNSMDTVADASTLTYAASLVGKTVTVGSYDEEGNIKEIVGTVEGTGTYQGVPVIFVNGEMYALSDIMAIGTLPEIPEEPEEPEGGESGGEGNGEDNENVDPTV